MDSSRSEMHDVLHDLFKESHHDGAGSRQAGGSGQGQGQGYPHWMMDMPGGSGAQYTSSHKLHAGSFCNKTPPVSKILQSIFFQPTHISVAQTSPPPTPQSRASSRTRAKVRTQDQVAQSQSPVMAPGSTPSPQAPDVAAFE